MTITVDYIKRLLLPQTIVSLKALYGITVHIDNCTIVSLITDVNLGHRRMTVDVITTSQQLLRIYVYGEGLYINTPVTVETSTKVRHPIQDYLTLYTHNIYLTSVDINSITQKIYAYLSQLTAVPEDAYPTYQCYYVDEDLNPTLVKTNRLICTTEEEDMAQAFFNWFRDTVGDLDGDGSVTSEDIRLWLKGDKGDPGADGADGINGTNGADGVDGVDGADGINGVDGVDGADGTNGVDGAPGSSGAGNAPSVLYTLVDSVAPWEGLPLDGSNYMNWQTPSLQVGSSAYDWNADVFTAVDGIFEIEVSVQASNITDGTYFRVLIESTSTVVASDEVRWDATNQVENVSLLVKCLVQSDAVSFNTRTVNIQTDADLTNVLFSTQQGYFRAVKIADVPGSTSASASLSPSVVFSLVNVAAPFEETPFTGTGYIAYDAPLIDINPSSYTWDVDVFTAVDGVFSVKAEVQIAGIIGGTYVTLAFTNESPNPLASDTISWTTGNTPSHVALDIEWVISSNGGLNSVVYPTIISDADMSGVTFSSQQGYFKAVKIANV